MSLQIVLRHIQVAFFLLVLAGCAGSHQAQVIPDCDWSPERVEATARSLKGWDKQVFEAVKTALPREADASATFADPLEVDGGRPDPKGPSFGRRTCTFRQATLRGAIVRLSIVDGAVNRNTFIQQEAFINVLLGTTRRDDVPVWNDVDGVLGADLICGVGAVDRCDNYQLLRQWNACNMVVVEVSHGRLSDQKDDVAAVSLAISDSIYGWLVSALPELECSSVGIPPKWLPR
jgi:hypothetical protein